MVDAALRITRRVLTARETILCACLGRREACGRNSGQKNRTMVAQEDLVAMDAPRWKGITCALNIYRSHFRFRLGAGGYRRFKTSSLPSDVLAAAADPPLRDQDVLRA